MTRTSSFRRRSKSGKQARCGTGITLPLLFAVAAIVPLGAQAQSTGQVRGKVVFDNWCAPCHAPGPKHPGTQALAVLYKGEKPDALEQRLDLTPEFISTYVRNGVSIMPPSRKTEISAADLADLSAYLTRAQR
jgi:mono/diheme cytochrome c family protein